MTDPESNENYWARVHNKLQECQRALELGGAPDRDEQQRILRHRAKMLARPAPNTTVPRDSLQVVEFLLAREHYGIELSFILEIHSLKEYCPLPSTPSFVLGVIPIRGHILSVIDIRSFFELPANGLTDLNKVLVLQHPRMEVGILADEVLSIRDIPLENLQSVPTTLTGIRADFIRGVTREALVVIDAEKLLLHRGIVVDEG
jgi:purine-binding chemotaxis protein CheW